MTDACLERYHWDQGTDESSEGDGDYWLAPVKGGVHGRDWSVPYPTLNHDALVMLDEDDDPRTGEFIEEALAAARSALWARARQYGTAGRDLKQHCAASKLGQALVLGVVPEPSPWDSLLGPVLRGRGAAARLGLSEVDLAELVARRGLLELRTADGFAVYPVFQFDGHQVVRGLDEVLAIFEPLAVTPWTLAGWFVTRSEDLGGLSPIDVLRSAGLTEALRRYAWETSCAFAQ